jgi:hypothetical protein
MARSSAHYPNPSLANASGYDNSIYQGTPARPLAAIAIAAPTAGAYDCRTLSRLAGKPLSASLFVSSPEAKVVNRSRLGRTFRVVAAVVFPLALVAICLLWAAFTALEQESPFYQKSMQVDRAQLEQARRELESQAGALYSDAGQVGSWYAVFTSVQINGWLALELAKNKPELLPTGIGDPRVAIAPNRFLVGFRSQRAGIRTVVSVESEVMLIEPSVVAIRLLNLRAGALPLPVAKVAEELRRLTRALSLPVRWTRVDGDPIALVDISSADRQLAIDSIELTEGEVYIAGHTLPSESVAPQQASRHTSDDSKIQ